MSGLVVEVSWKFLRVELLQSSRFVSQSIVPPCGGTILGLYTETAACVGVQHVCFQEMLVFVFVHRYLNSLLSL